MNSLELDLILIHQELSTNLIPSERRAFSIHNIQKIESSEDQVRELVSQIVFMKSHLQSRPNPILHFEHDTPLDWIGWMTSGSFLSTSETDIVNILV